MNRDIVIIGGGPAGLAAALAAREAGVKDILILERDRELGGILQQCIHNGFGLHTFQEELTGPEYSWRFIERVKKENIEYMLDTMVLDISPDKKVTAVNSKNGIMEIQAKAVILCMGCRERSRGALNIPGTRPAGIFTAGTAQRYINMEGYMPGKKVVILGSGDIGLIMARRMTLEGAEVKMVCEVMPFSGGLTRNIVQCLDDFGIPLRLSYTVIQTHGKERLTGVTVAKVDENRKPIPGTEEYVECDTLLLSVGLIPENELSRKAQVEMNPITGGPVVSNSMEASVEGIFACGNVLHVHDLVDHVSKEAERAGKNAAQYVLHGEAKEEDIIQVKPGRGVRYVVPNKIAVKSNDEKVQLMFRVDNIYKNPNLKVVAKVNGQEDKVLLTRRKPKCAPGEMEELALPYKSLEGLSQAEISVFIEEVK